MAGGSKPGERRGGRKKGTPNKAKLTEREVAARVKERVAEQVKLIEAKAKAAAEPSNRLAEMLKIRTPLEFMIEIMNDDTAPPTFRFEAAKAAAPYLHSRAPEKKPETEQVNHITEIRRVIVEHRIEHSDGARIPSAPWRSPV